MDRISLSRDRTSPRPWHLDIQTEYGELFHPLFTYCRGILDANGDWVVRFDDDYGTDQWTNAKLIVEAVNEYDRRDLSGPVSS